MPEGRRLAHMRRSPLMNQRHPQNASAQQLPLVRQRDGQAKDHRRFPGAITGIINEPTTILVLDLLFPVTGWTEIARQ